MLDHARPQRKGAPGPGKGRGAITGAPRWLAVIVVLSAAVALARGLWVARPSLGGGTGSPHSPTPSSNLAASGVTVLPQSSVLPQTSTPAAAGPLPVGIVAGHWGSDSGAVCEGWLQEVDINLAIAQRVVYTLRALGYPTDLLGEFDPRLEGYRAQALVSIHADSCLYPEASGFKVARVEDSTVPAREDRLVNCLVSRYRSRTGLAFHEGSITPDMTRYHTFYEMAPETPGAIIEVGFMLADRDLLLYRQDLVAQGIVEGILCFLRGEIP